MLKYNKNISEKKKRFFYNLFILMTIYVNYIEFTNRNEIINLHIRQ